MSEKEHSTTGSAPSAPAEEDAPSLNPSDRTATLSPYQQSPHPQSGLLLTSPPPVNDGTEQSPYREPPPSYQAAMAYPAASLPYPTNPDGTTFLKPPYGAIPPYCGPVPPPITSQQFPPPPPPLPLTTPQTQVVINSTSTAEPRIVGNCTHCGVGIVSGQTDLCCLICLIMLTICTFPVGLLFLCFVPCTIHKRCSHCRRHA